MSEKQARRVAGIALGLDVGTKTIGLALTDPIGLLATPLRTLSRKGVRADVEALVPTVEERGVAHLVVGMPYELDGSEGRSARLARQVGDALAARTGLPLHYVDERYSSVEAERRMIASGARRKKRRDIVDQVAAVVILEAWLARFGRGEWV